MNVEVTLRNPLRKDDFLVYSIDVFNKPIAELWYTALQELLQQNRYLEKNFCFLGFPDSQRSLEYICKELTWAKSVINDYFKNEYRIDEVFEIDCIRDPQTLKPNQELLNKLHNHFENLQGTVWQLSDYYARANYETKFAIRQLNNLCHEAESLILSQRKKMTAPEWIRPSQITTFLNATRYEYPENLKQSFDESHYDRKLGEVYLHWSQIGKTLYEVFRDENGSDIDKVVCEAITHLRYYSGEFDIEWARDVCYNGKHPWYTADMSKFKPWLHRNGFNTNETSYNFGYHPVGQVNLEKSFGTKDVEIIWNQLSTHLDIYKIKAGEVETTYDYSWADSDYYQQQIDKLKPGYDFSSKYKKQGS